MDDKSSVCLPFLLELLDAHPSPQPLIVGLNGLQGVGKTTLAAALVASLEARGIAAVACSIDDFYLRREDQVALAHRHADNALLQHRGEPGDMSLCAAPLARAVFASLARGLPTKIPRYDKAAYNGRGDRLPESCWRPVNQPDQAPVRVVILEGWCVGFRALSNSDVEARWRAPSRTLLNHRLEHLLLVNDMLRSYDGLTDLLDVMIHVDAEHIECVYTWRQQQEDALRVERRDPNAGMTPDQVLDFVDGYFPAYELYTQGIRSGVLPDRPGCQLRLVVDRDRNVKQVLRI
ncbi:hypothetical protein L249_8904 [Ophiocordyceps polyrhachis-furcata BCC 54312]|uniref:SRP54-type proteins GTP-binding domain-containing protein n=1 Tax=Ophiocordyceps polyrhachis-furcata BCC 54312 TaxID=1330021 RepID=A0A367L1W6_9HYPO|nr:hypothetical protein L249_8904 [Ophiocordyceps polyrhachis-furcata BCC 54312]